ALSPQGERLATASGKTIHIWKVGDWTPEGELWPIDAEVTALGWSEDGRGLAVGTADGRILRGTVESRQLATEVGDLGRPVSVVALAGPGIRYTLAGDALPGGKANGEPAIGNVTGSHLSPVSADVAAVLATGAVRVYDADERRWRDLPPDGDASAVAYSSDGNVLAVGTRAGAVRLWDAISLTPMTDPFAVRNSVSAL